MLQTKCISARATMRLDQHIDDVQLLDTRFVVGGNFSKNATDSVVIATGSLSIPKIGATGFRYRIAKKFGLTMVLTRFGVGAAYV